MPELWELSDKEYTFLKKSKDHFIKIVSNGSTPNSSNNLEKKFNFASNYAKIRPSYMEPY